MTQGHQRGPKASCERKASDGLIAGWVWRFGWEVSLPPWQGVSPHRPWESREARGKVAWETKRGPGDRPRGVTENWCEHPPVSLVPLKSPPARDTLGQAESPVSWHEAAGRTSVMAKCPRWDIVNSRLSHHGRLLPAENHSVTGPSAVSLPAQPDPLVASRPTTIQTPLNSTPPHVPCPPARCSHVQGAGDFETPFHRGRGFSMHSTFATCHPILGTQCLASRWWWQHSHSYSLPFSPVSAKVTKATVVPLHGWQFY